MEITGRHRVPAARSRLWEALSDEAVVESCLPPEVAFDQGGAAAGGGRRLRFFDRAVLSMPAEIAPPGRASFVVSPAEPDRPGWSGRLDAVLTDEDPFTVVSWRWLADGDAAADAAALTAAVDGFLERIGQHAAVPVTVAAEGLSGVAASLTEAAPPAHETPFAPLLARIRAWPRDLAIGGGLFALVLLIVIGVI